jgi:hypothetical protein
MKLYYYFMLGVYAILAGAARDILRSRRQYVMPEKTLRERGVPR